MLDIRLQTCFDMVSGRGTVCDVGTDHALLAAELINSGKCAKVIASDIKEGPLAAAAKTVERSGISDKVELILSDGLANVPLEGVSDIVIAGMGGETIADIIAAADIPENTRLILQPMTKAEILRKRLYELGFEIFEERLAEDGDKLYTIISAEHSLADTRLTEFEALYGFSDSELPLTQKFRKREAERLFKVAENIGKSGKINDSVHAEALAKKMESGTDIVKVEDICALMNELYPFDSQEKWDNSGLLVENSCMECGSVLLALDISSSVVAEAEKKGVDLIISHHPVIFEPRRRITRNDPVFKLISADIAALCMHTNVDISPFGTNGLILRELGKRFAFEGDAEYFSADKCGYAVTLQESVPAAEFAAALKEIFGCEYVRVSAGAENVKKVGFCSGSGGSFIGDISAFGCDAFVTGDVKHDVWHEAENCGVSLFDCGHFHTENPVIWEFRRQLEERFPQLDVEIAESSTDPCVYF